MALKTFGALTFATLSFASAVLNGAPTDGTNTFKPTTFGAGYFGSQTLHGVRNRSHITPVPSVVPGFGSVRIFDRDKKKKRRQAKAISYLTRNEVENGPIDRDTNTPLVTQGIPGSIEQVGDASVRISRLERPVQGTLPAALGASIAASDALSFGINNALRQIEEKQSEEDDELALILIMMDM